MIYIIEGGDLSGKTKLAQELSTLKGIPIIKKPLQLILGKDKRLLKNDTIELLTHFFWESIVKLGEHYDFIVDRSLISSIVFTKYFGRNYDISYINFYLSYCKHIKILYLDTSLEVIEERWRKRGDTYFNLEEVKKINSLYKETIIALLKSTPKDLIIRISNLDEKLIRDPNFKAFLKEL